MSQDGPPIGADVRADRSSGRPGGRRGRRRDGRRTPGRPADAGPAASRGRRSRGPLVVGLVIAVLVAAGVAAAVRTGAVGGPRASAPTPEVVVLPSPTPTIAAVARAPLSPFADSLPAGVLGFALTAVTEHRPLLLAGALEGYRLDYSDGGTRPLTVLAGQWPTAAEADAAYTAAVAAAGTPAADGEPAGGDVVVGGSVVGAWTVTGPGEGVGTVTWSNGTAMLQLTGPEDVVRDAYAAYPY